MLAHSTTRRSRRKCHDRPEKPYDGFPLQPHGSGHWCKRVRGRLCYFGRWGKRENGKLAQLPDGGNWQAALVRYNDEINYLTVGRIPPTRADYADGLRLAELFNRFLTSKQRKVDARELKLRSFKEYREATDLAMDTFGNRLVDDIRPEDFEALRAKFAKTWGPHRVGKFVQMVRSAFRYGLENGLIEKPILFGSEFKKPSKEVLKRHKNSGDKRLFTPVEIRTILAALNGDEVTIVMEGGKQKQVKLQRDLTMRAAVLLAINTGCGNSDVSGLRFSHLDLQSGWLDFPRIKTGVSRRAPLWPETIDGIKAAIELRPEPKSTEDSQTVLLNRKGHRLIQTTERSHHDGVSIQFARLLRRLNICRRRGMNFYALRHSFASIGLQAKDRPAVKSLMGHSEGDVLSVYDELGVEDERLIKVVEHIHRWLFGNEEV